MRRSANRGTVLVVDDQERNIQVVGTTLTALGYEVMAAMDGEQALARVEARSPDLILLDMLMPGIDGLEVCNQLKRRPRFADIPIIFLSAADDPNMIVRALEAGGVDYITKPFNKAELLARVRTHMELKQWRDDCAGLIEKREEFVAMMAHDLKNPIGGAHLACQVLTEMDISEENYPRIQKLVSTVMDGVGRSLALVESFLEDARSSQIEVELHSRLIDLAICVSEAVLRHQQRAQQKSITVHFEPSDSKIAVQADPAAAARVLDNLLSNALKFSPVGGEIWVEMDRQANEVLVRDSGPGFTDEDKENLFKSYQRLSAKPTGDEPSTGLGLSIANKIASAMGGELTLDSNANGEGACFRFSLPKA